MDKRVIRTKRTIKETLVKLLQKTQFEHITVKTICDEACTSRITFYNYYSDKYALVEEMFEDYMNEALADYYALQKENNKEKDDIKGYNNMLTAIINLVTNNRDFFEHTGTASNPYLYSGFYNYIYNCVMTYINHHHDNVKPKYPINQIVNLMCNGLWGIIAESFSANTDFAELKKNIFGIYNDILRSGLFERTQPNLVG